MHYDLTRPSSPTPRPLRHRARRAGGRRLLRHHARAPRRRGRALPRPRRRPPQPEHEPGATSIYSPGAVRAGHSFLIIGERTNANGSKKFREAMLAGDWDTCVQMANEQVARGRPRARRVRRLRRPRRHRRHGRDRSPLRHPGQRAARARLHRARGDGGRPAVDRRPGHPQLGQPRGRRRARQPARPGPVAGPEYGAAVICLLIDEEGQARDVEWKLRSPTASTTSPSSATASSRAT
jgi:5-methyltetrahydrofolate--homocysteine methyltransferase